MKSKTAAVWLGAAGLALLAGGFLAGRLTSPATPVPDHYADLSGLSPEAQKMFASPGFLAMLSEFVHLENGEIKLYAATDKIADKVMPAGFPAWPGQLRLQEPSESMGWIEAKLAGGEALAGAKDRWTIVNLWATWCAPCVVELPDFNTLAGAVGDKVGVFVINADPTGKDTPDTVATMFADKGYASLAPLHVSGETLDAVLAGAGMSRARTAYPMTVIFAPGGKPFAFVQDSSSNWKDGESGWATPGMIAFFETLSTLPAPG